MPVIETKGAASSGGFGQFAQQAPVANYIEDVFSTYLYTGNGSTQTIPNGIDLAGKGGLVWVKARNASQDNALWTCNLFGDQYLRSNTTDALVSSGLSYLSNGFSADASFTYLNASATTYASWTFRKQPKFFDVVTYMGNGANRTIAHNLGSVPGCIMVKRVDGYGGNWVVYHRSLSNTQGIYLNQTAAAVEDSTFWNSTTPTSTNFSLGTNINVNATDGLGGTYVAYLFAHDAGGFGAAGTDNVITCGSYTGNGGSLSVNLGHEAQWVLIKRSDAGGSWLIVDNMRAMSETSTLYLYPSFGFSEVNPGLSVVKATSTGFNLPISSLYNGNGATYIYMAIRRGPMRTPTSGTSVFALSQWVGANQNQDMGAQTASFGTGFMSILKNRNTAQTNGVFSNLIGSQPFLWTSGTNAESADPGGLSVVNNRLQLNQTSYFGAGGDGSGSNYIGWHFRRAPGFFDVVCWTGNGTSQNLSHNLQVAPTLIFCKQRSLSGESWATLCSEASSSPDRRRLFLNYANAGGGLNSYFSDAGGTPVLPTSSVFTVGPNDSVNTSGQKYVAYLFATLAGVSKVGAYTGTGATQQINCGFTGGARYVMIKRTDSTGDWYAWDSARGIVAGDDPYLLLNSAVAEVTNTDYIDTLSTGFEISSTAPAAINANGGSYIFLAIA